MRSLGVAVLAVGLTSILLGCGSGPATAEEPAAGASAPHHASLRLGSDPWPPFTDSAPRPRVAIELVHKALQRSGVQAATTIQDDFGQITRQIGEGELDGSAAIWRSEDREAHMLFSAPYFENRLVLVGTRKNRVTGVTLEDLSEKRIGVVSGYAYGPVLRSVKALIFFKEGSSDLENLKSLDAGELDYVLADGLLVHHLMQGNERARRLLRVGDVTIARRSLHFAIRRSHPQAKEIIRGFDRAIKTMMSDGSFNRILQLDAIEVDVDGDGRCEVVFAGGSIGLSPPTSTYALFRGDAGAGTGARYRVEGRTYETWDDIPKRYRTERGRQDEGVQLYELNF